MTDLVTIIIPVYKVEEYLDACIRSVAAQTYENLEIILVDDGSPDRCGSICEEWSGKDRRISVIHKTNDGLSDARNAGMAAASGQYIVFIDSDDVVSPVMIEMLHSVLQKYSADIAECGYLSFVSDIPEETSRDDQTEAVYSAEEALSLLMEGKVFRYPVWNKMYRREILKDLQFEKGKLHEDVFFTYQVFGRSEKIIKTDHKLYYYRQRKNSIMGSTFSLRNLDVLEARSRQYSYMKENYPALSGKALNHLLGSCLYMGQKYLMNPDKNCRNSALRQIQTIFQENYAKEDIPASLKKRMWFILAEKDIKLCCRIRNLLRIGL